MTAARTIWLTGLPASGKTTLARELASELERRGISTVLLDGDELRTTVHADLGFGRDDRAEHVRRTAALCRAAMARGSWPIVALVSPWRTDREAAYAAIGNVLEVHVATPLAVCMQRDGKSWYARARQGIMHGLTGWDAPYEAPSAPEVRYDAAQTTVADGVGSILRQLIMVRALP